MQQQQKIGDQIRFPSFVVILTSLHKKLRHHLVSTKKFFRALDTVGLMTMPGTARNWKQRRKPPSVVKTLPRDVVFRIFESVISQKNLANWFVNYGEIFSK